MSMENVSESAPAASTESASPSVAENVSSDVSSGISSGVESTNASEFSEELGEAIEDGASDEEINKMIREYELKVNGKTIKASLDLSNDEEIKKYLQKAHAFNEAAQEASKYKKDLEKLTNDHKFTTSRFEEVLQEWKKVPAKMFEQLGVDKQEWLAQQVEEYLAEQEMDPKEKEIRAERQKREALEKRLKEIEEKEQLSKKEQEERAAREAEEREVADLQSSITSGLDSSETLKFIEKSGLISKAELFNEAVNLMIRETEATESNVSFEEILPKLEAKYKGFYEIAKKSTPAKKAPAPAKKVVPASPNDVKPTATSKDIANSISKKTEEKKSFADVMRRR